MARPISTPAADMASSAARAANASNQLYSGAVTDFREAERRAGRQAEDRGG